MVEGKEGTGMRKNRKEVVEVIGTNGVGRTRVYLVRIESCSMYFPNTEIKFINNRIII